MPPADDLFDYDAGLEELLREPTAPNNSTTKANNDKSKGSGGDAGLGLDEEVKVTRKRAPVAKLDENRLLSQNGIPKLRRTAKTKLKLKGKKGHEFSDAARLLTFYQLWLDDLYPRAKFADALSMVEKLGHSKRMQVMRREWIEEGKPRAYPKDDDDVERREGVEQRGNEEMHVDRGSNNTGDAELQEEGGGADTNGLHSNEGGVSSLFGDGRRITQNDENDDDDDDEELFVSDPNIHSKPTNSAHNNIFPDEEDDLDALLDETEGGGQGTANLPPPPNEENFDDDMEAMNMYGL